MVIKVTVGLCVRNGAQVVKNAFKSISIQDYPHELMKLVIVNDGSVDNTLSLAQEFARGIDIQTVIISTTGVGLGTARQLVVNNADGDYIVWVDDDLVLSKDFIRNHVEFMEKNPNVGAARGIYNLNINNPSIIELPIFVYAILNNTPNPKAIGTGGAIFRIKALENVGGFDIHIKGAGEDKDISHRIIKSGWALATNTSSKVYSSKNNPKTWPTLWKKWFGYGYGNHLLYHKHNFKELLIEIFPPLALLSIIKLSIMIYRLNNMKKIFFLAVPLSFIYIAKSFGFLRAHFDEYGHTKDI